MPRCTRPLNLALPCRVAVPAVAVFSLLFYYYLARLMFTRAALFTVAVTPYAQREPIILIASPRAHRASPTSLGGKCGSVHVYTCHGTTAGRYILLIAATAVLLLF